MIPEPKIEEGIPCPRPSGPRNPAGKAAGRMKTGDSIFVESERDLDAARCAIRRLGGKFQQRKMDGGWRIWRLA